MAQSVVTRDTVPEIIDSGPMCMTTDNGHPERAFFQKFETFGLGQTIWADKFWGIWGIFSRFISTFFGTVSPLFMFHINQPLFVQKTKPLYPNIYLGLGFKFGPQIIRDLAIVCPLSECTP